jgi:hypothetical protein
VLTSSSLIVLEINHGRRAARRESLPRPTARAFRRAPLRRTRPWSSAQLVARAGRAGLSLGPDVHAHDQAIGRVAGRAQCQELRHKGGQFAVASVEFVFGGSGKLQSIRDIKWTRPWSKP